MSDGLDEIDDILDARDAAIRQETELREQEAARYEAWAVCFEQWIDETALPSLEPFALKLRERGFDAAVKRGSESRFVEAPEHPESVSLSARSPDRVGLSITFNRKNEGTVEVVLNAGSLSTSPAKLKDLTPERLADMAMDAVRTRYARDSKD